MQNNTSDTFTCKIEREYPLGYDKAKKIVCVVAVGKLDLFLKYYK